MKITNIMNFVRTFEPRDLEIEAMLFDTAKSQLELSVEMELPSTFLLEYDALCDERYVELFRAVKDNPKIELGFWYEVVEPLTSAIGIPYNSPRGFKWDWFIDPGYAMAYENGVKEKLIDEAMRKFKEIFGSYPRTVASWVLDTYTVNYLCKNYEIDALMICRDQVNTDAYTMVGGYFNGAYYPSKNNVFTPGSDETRLNVPVFRLLGPDPIHNYDSHKYLTKEIIEKSGQSVFTLEPVCYAGHEPDVVDWFFDTYYRTECVGMAYTQIGQENSFANFDLVTPLRMQYEKLLERGVSFLTVSETGRLFKATYDKTPSASVSALTNWDSKKAQSVYYSCEGYVANFFTADDKAFIRALYLFDDRVEDTYLNSKCTTFDSVHENMPIVDTWYQRGNTDGGYGIIFDTGTTVLSQSIDGDVLTLELENGSVSFDSEGISVTKCKLEFTPKMCNTKITLTKSGLEYEYKSHKYLLKVVGATPRLDGEKILICGESVKLIPTKI